MSGPTSHQLPLSVDVGVVVLQDEEQPIDGRVHLDDRSPSSLDQDGPRDLRVPFLLQPVPLQNSRSYGQGGLQFLTPTIHRLRVSPSMVQESQFQCVRGDPIHKDVEYHPTIDHQQIVGVFAHRSMVKPNSKPLNQPLCACLVAQFVHNRRHHLHLAIGDVLCQANRLSDERFQIEYVEYRYRSHRRDANSRLVRIRPSHHPVD